MLDPRVIGNDLSSFDHVLYATNIYGRRKDHENGDFAVDGLEAWLPSPIRPDKVEVGDIAFRKAVWGKRYGAGRPPTAPGDLYIDFGFVGVAIGALLIGMVAAAMVGLVRGPPGGREYRIALFAISLIVLHELVSNTSSLAFGLVVTLALPFLIAVHLFGRGMSRRGRPARSYAG